MAPDNHFIPILPIVFQPAWSRLNLFDSVSPSKAHQAGSSIAMRTMKIVQNGTAEVDVLIGIPRSALDGTPLKSYWRSGMELPRPNRRLRNRF